MLSSTAVDVLALADFSGMERYLLAFKIRWYVSPYRNVEKDLFSFKMEKLLLHLIQKLLRCVWPREHGSILKAIFHFCCSMVYPHVYLVA